MPSDGNNANNNGWRGPNLIYNEGPYNSRTSKFWTWLTNAIAHVFSKNSSDKNAQTEVRGYFDEALTDYFRIDEYGDVVFDPANDDTADDVGKHEKINESMEKINSTLFAPLLNDKYVIKQRAINGLDQEEVLPVKKIQDIIDLAILIKPEATERNKNKRDGFYKLVYEPLLKFRNYQEMMDAGMLDSLEELAEKNRELMTSIKRYVDTHNPLSAAGFARMNFANALLKSLRVKDQIYDYNTMADSLLDPDEDAVDSSKKVPEKKAEAAKDGAKSNEKNLDEIDDSFSLSEKEFDESIEGFDKMPEKDLDNSESNEDESKMNLSESDDDIIQKNNLDDSESEEDLEDFIIGQNIHSEKVKAPVKSRDELINEEYAKHAKYLTENLKELIRGQKIADANLAHLNQYVDSAARFIALYKVDGATEKNANTFLNLKDNLDSQNRSYEDIINDPKSNEQRKLVAIVKSTVNNYANKELSDVCQKAESIVEERERLKRMNNARRQVVQSKPNVQSNSNVQSNPKAQEKPNVQDNSKVKVEKKFGDDSSEQDLSEERDKVDWNMPEEPKKGRSSSIKGMSERSYGNY